jgi:hypothetical protein
MVMKNRSHDGSLGKNASNFNEKISIQKDLEPSYES